PDVPSARIDGISFRGGYGELAVKIGAIGHVVRRIEFDHALAEIAMKRGVRIEQATPVTAVRARGAGAVVDTPRGEIEAAVVIGADGVGSVVRRAMGLSKGKLRA